MAWGEENDMKTYDDIMDTWRPSHCAFMALCDYPTASAWAEYDFLHPEEHEPYPTEVSRSGEESGHGEKE